MYRLCGALGAFFILASASHSAWSADPRPNPFKPRPQVAPVTPGPVVDLPPPPPEILPPPAFVPASQRIRLGAEQDGRSFIGIVGNKVLYKTQNNEYVFDEIR